jgi:hypothetical protein
MEEPRVEKRTRSEKEGEVKEPKKKRARRAILTQVGHHFIRFDYAFPKEKIHEVVQDLIADTSEAGIQTDIQFISGERVVLKPTEEETKEQKRVWRREYRKLPHVKAKIDQEAKSEKGKTKRKKYNSDSKVSLRKKSLNKRNKTVLTLLAKEKPDLYKKYIKESGIDDPEYNGNPNWVPRKYWNVITENPPTTPVPQNSAEGEKSNDSTETSESDESSSE